MKPENSCTRFVGDRPAYCASMQARISTAMVLQPLSAGFLKTYPDVQIELTNDEGYVDIVERGFDAGVRIGESVQKDMVAVPLGGSITVAIVGSPDYFRRYPVPRHPSDRGAQPACDSGSPVAVPFTSGSLRWSADSSNTRSAAISRSSRLGVLGRGCAGGDRTGIRIRATRASPHTSQEAEARVDQLLTDVSRVLPLLPQQEATAVQAEGLRRVRAGAFAQALRMRPL